MAITIQFNEYSFDQSGVPQWSESTTYESIEGGRARTARTVYTVKIQFQEDSYSSNEARIALLRSALSATEGRLLIKDENDVILVSQVVNVQKHDVPDEWRQYAAMVTVVFEGRNSVRTDSLEAALTPTGGTLVKLPNVTSWRESIRTERYSEDRSNRKISVVNIAASGYILADKNKPAADRLAELQGKLIELREANTKDGTLVYGTESRLVKVDSLDGVPNDGSDRLVWSLSASYNRFPSGTYAEAEFDVAERDDIEAGMRLLTVQGSVRAVGKSVGEAKVAELVALYATGRRQSSGEITHKQVDGGDGAEWILLNFNYTFQSSLPTVLNSELRVTTREDVRNADVIVTYEGKVSGKTAGDALTYARTIGRDKMPFMVTSAETISTKTTEGQTEQFVEVVFSYEYMEKSGTWLYAELTRAVSGDPFSDRREVVSGYAAASTTVAAENLGRSFKLSGRLARDVSESTAERVAVKVSTQTRQATRFDFSYTYYVSPVSVSISYGREEAIDYTNLERTVTYTGTAFGPSEEACNAAIDAITVAGLAVGKRTSRSRVAAIEKQNGVTQSGTAGSGAQLTGISFTERFLGVLSGEPGLDIIEAEYSLDVVYSINRAVITPIPFGVPHVQTSCGVTVGSKTASGSVTAITEASARAWGRGKRNLAITGGYEDAPQERTNFLYPAMNGTTVKAHRFEFTYTARFPELYLS